MGFGFGYALFWKRFILEVLTCFDLVFITMYSYSLLVPFQVRFVNLRSSDKKPLTKSGMGILREYSTILRR